MKYCLKKRYGMLKVLEKTEERSTDGCIIWKCQCDCGNITFVKSTRLRNGMTRSCKCWRKISVTTHGMSKHPSYKSWTGLKERCKNTTTIGYKNYGGRGIKVCDRWKNSFENFYEDMGDTWKDGLSIDRINNDGNYCKENCRWATRQKQHDNRKSSHFLFYQNENKSVMEWAKTIGISYKTLYRRVYTDKWSVERALTTPLRAQSKKE